jgi:hypothetical protein
MNLLDLEIYAWIDRYLRGDATVDEFEDWFVSEAWEVERTGNVPAIEVAGMVRAALVELSAAEIDESEFREQLGLLAAQRRDRIRIFQAMMGESHEPINEFIEVTPDREAV